MYSTVFYLKILSSEIFNDFDIYVKRNNAFCNAFCNILNILQAVLKTYFRIDVETLYLHFKQFSANRKVLLPNFNIYIFSMDLISKTNLFHINGLFKKNHFDKLYIFNRHYESSEKINLYYY